MPSVRVAARRAPRRADGPRRACAVDAYEFASLEKEQLNKAELTGLTTLGGGAAQIVEYKPHFHEWATVQPGEKQRESGGRESERESTRRHPGALPAPPPLARTPAGMICVSRKKKTAVFRQYTAAETAGLSAHNSSATQPP